MTGRYREEEGCGFGTKAPPNFHGHDDEAAPPGLKKLWVRAFFAAPCVGHCGPCVLAAAPPAWPTLVSGKTRVVSIANWAPLWSGRTLAITSIRLFLSRGGC